MSPLLVSAAAVNPGNRDNRDHRASDKRPVRSGAVDSGPLAEARRTDPAAYGRASRIQPRVRSAAHRQSNPERRRDLATGSERLGRRSVARGRLELLFGVQVARNRNGREHGDDEQADAHERAAEQNFTDPEERRVDEHASQ